MAGQITGTDGADYIVGGLTGGSDQLSGLGGDDRLAGGFRGAGQAASATGIDADLLTGGTGRDVFEARFWYEEGGFPGYGSSRLLGPHSDIVTDFTRGEDRLDLSFEWHSNQDYLASGGFRFVDTNGNGVVDAGDAYASLQQVTVGGVTKSSLVLDLAGAEAAAGQFHGVAIEPVAHTLTLFGVTSLTGADFVPETVYLGLRGGSGNDTLTGNGNAQILYGNAGNDTLDGGGGVDILAGGDGNDVFRVRQAGSVTVADFAHGQDRLDLGVTFASLDTNHNNVLDAGDAGVSIVAGHQLLAPELAPSVGDSTQITLRAAGGTATVLVHGVTGLTAADLGESSGGTPPPPPPSGGGNQITGTDGADTLNGTSGVDLIDGKGGDDHLAGLGGDDVVHGGDGNDQVAGDAGILTFDHGQGGNDTLYGDAGIDWLDGGGGNDVLHGGADSDDLFGGFGGNDTLYGEDGGDRLSGGLRDPVESPTATGIDHDVLWGGAGPDIFEGRFWYRESGWDSSSDKLLGPHQDIVMDFTKGLDRLDMVLYWQASSHFDFTRGGFGRFDTNHDGVLDGSDRFVTVGQVTADGVSKLSTILDVGAADLAAGIFQGVTPEAGQHDLTIYGVTGLTATDFVDDKTYRGLFNGDASVTLTAGAGAQWVAAGGGNDILDGGAGDDLLRGEAGNDIFRFRYDSSGGPGADIVQDFAKGQDRLDIGVSFATLDTNHDNILDVGDKAFQKILNHQLIVPGMAPDVADSTLIDLDVATGRASSFTGVNTVMVHSVTDLGASDFVNPATGVA